MLDREAFEYWVEEKLEREAAHQTLQAVVAAMESVFPLPLTRGQCPRDLRIFAAGRDGTWIVDDHGRPILRTNSTDDTVLVLPEKFSSGDAFICNHTVDRCSTGLAGLNYMFFEKMMWAVHYGLFHDLWNSIRTAAKLVHGGIVWKWIVKFATVANFNHGPYRTGQWRRLKTEQHRRYVDTKSWESADVQQLCRNQAKMHGRECTAESQYRYEFGLLRSPAS